MEFTGERIIPDIPQWEHLYLEHFYRYLFAKEFIKDKIVLDVASGTGYGSGYLKDNKAKAVIGADINFEAVSYSKKNFQHALYLQADAIQLPFRDDFFDAVVSFETIEHLREYKKFLYEIKRVLKKTGLLLISSPNKLNYHGGDAGGKNRFHFKELYLEEFSNLLNQHFSTIEIYGQHCTKLHKDYSNKDYKPKLKDILINKEKIEKANFFISLCADCEIKMTPEIQVSIIIPIFNCFSYTKQCIEKILPELNYNTEIIVINDASKEDKIYDYLNSIQNKVKVIHNKKNNGFLKSCNKGAKLAQGKYLLFLNNDTIPQENWLENLVEIVEKNEKIGAVGAKLIYPDGILQEAGAIIFNDGSGYNYGRNDDQNKYEYNYVREVDYCSGACLLVRKDVFKKIGGFDEKFSPAFYEDTDLCFSIRKLGYKVMYQPKSKVIHFEGASCGRDLTSGIKKYQEINKTKFVEKWKKELIHQYPHDKKNVSLAADRQKGKKILFFYPHLPSYDRDSGAFRLFNILKILINEGHRIALLSDNQMLEGEKRYKEKMEELGIMVIKIPEFKKGNFISTRTLQRKRFIKNLYLSHDILWFVHYHMAYKYLDSRKKYAKNVRYITDSVDLHFLREQRESELLNDKNKVKKITRTKKKELSVFKKSDIVIAITEKEKQIINKECPDIRVEVITNIHPIIKNHKNFNGRENLLFIGGYLHCPNSNAVKYFVSEIFPLIRTKIKNITFYVVGGEYPNHFIDKYSNKNISFTGPVNSTQVYLQKCKVLVAPLRYGAGMKGKVGEAMSSGIPVVTTSIGAEGMGLIDGENILIADTPEEFTDKVAIIYHDKDLWNKISINGKKYIETHFSPEIVGKSIKKMIDFE